MPVSNTLSDPFIATAVWAGLGAFGLTLVLSLQIVLMRVGLRRRQAAEANALARWRPVLNAAVVGELPAEDGAGLPPLPPRDLQPFLRLWVHLQGSVRGDAGESLNTLARRLRLDDEALAMLARGPRSARLLGALVLGHLRERRAWSGLLELATDADSTLSLTALWALVRIDPEAAAGYLTPLFIEREDWALSHVAGILQQASAPAAGVLARLLPTLDAAKLPRALRIAEALRLTLPPAVLGEALDSPAVPVVLAALRNVLTPETIAQVRSLLAHQDWQVRVQAARALGRVGEREDAERLAALLRDPQWWVRYRAAEALRDLPALRRPELEALRAALTDRFASDMLAQVMAEGSPA